MCVCVCAIHDFVEIGEKGKEEFKNLVRTERSGRTAPSPLCALVLESG